jgi:outer membrane protein
MALPLKAADFKIGVVNPTAILEQAPQAKAALKRLEKEFAPRDKKAVAEQKALKKLEDKLNRDGPIMSESARRSAERDLVSRKRDLRRELDALRDDRTFRSNEERTKLLNYVNEAIKAVGKKDGYDLILYEGIAYAKPNVDLTKKILNYLKKQAKK